MTAIVQQELVSIIIPVFNRAEMIVEAINSVLEQDYRPIELIVVDDGSTDDTLQVLRALQNQFSEIQVLGQVNAGPGAARELGRQHASGEFIQYHDSDDLLLPGKFSSQVAALQANPECDVAYGKTERLRLGQSPRSQPLKLSGTRQQAMFPLFLRSRWWSTSTALHRRSVTDSAGAWLPTRCEEDWEYDCRIAALGGRLAFVDQFVSITRAHDDHLSLHGTTDPQKLRDRCLARTAIHKHGLDYQRCADRVTNIDQDDWCFFSKSVFLLARECAAAGLSQQAKRMLELSVRANGGATYQHRIFALVGLLLGWRCAAYLVKVIGR